LFVKYVWASKGKVTNGGGLKAVAESTLDAMQDYSESVSSGNSLAGVSRPGFGLGS